MKCKRCGKCCIELSDRDIWTGGSLTWQEKQHLLVERKKRPKNKHKKGCLMLYFKNNKAHCLVDELYLGKKEKNCQGYLCDEVKNG